MATSRVAVFLLIVLIGHAVCQTGVSTDESTTGTTGSVSTTGSQSTTGASTTGPHQESKIVELRLEGTVETFNQSQFVLDLADYLGIDASLIQIVAIRSGSVIVYFKIQPDNSLSQSPDEIANSFIGSASTFGATYGYTVVSAGVVDNVPSDPVVPAGSSSGISSGAIAGAIIGSILGAMLLVSVGAIVYRRAKDRDSSRNLEAGIELTAPHKKAEESDEEDSSEEEDDDEDDDDDDDEEETKKPAQENAKESTKEPVPAKKDEHSDDESSEEDSGSEESSSDEK